MEWLCLEFGRAAGFEVPAAALIEMPDGMSPALVVERFDIRRGPEDQRLWLWRTFAPFWIFRPRRNTTARSNAWQGRAPAIDGSGRRPQILFRRAIFAWLIADGDMHMKNFALLKTADAGGGAFTTVRFAPLYDAVTTRVSPALGDRMALKLNGKDDRLNAQDFLALARTIGLTAGGAEAAIADLAARLADAAPNLALPEGLGEGVAKSAEGAIRSIVTGRIEAFR